MYSKSLVVLIFFFLVSCTVNQKPEFIKIDQIKVSHSTVKNIVVTANAHFLNKNSVGGNLQLTNLNVYVDSIAVAEVNSKVFIVPKKDIFAMPITVKIPYDKVFKKNKNDFLNNVLNMLTRKEILVQYKGKITYRLGKFSYQYDVDYADKVKLNF
jgi:hypothetical protein